MKTVGINDLDGFFDYAITVFLPNTNSEQNRVKKLNDKNIVIEFAHHKKTILHKIKLYKTNFILNNLKLINLLIKYIIDKKVNLIRAQDPHLFGINAYILSKITRIPYQIHIITNYDIKDRQVRKLAFPPFMFRAIQYYNVILCR